MTQPTTGSDLFAPRSGRPFARGELQAAFTRPQRILDVVFTDRARLVETLSQRDTALLLAALLVYASVLFALPYGAILGWRRFWNVALLFLGSLAICLPSQQVFSAYVGLRVHTRQNLALGLVITSVASLFTFGFFPILWFLDATMVDDALVTPRHLSIGLLILSLAAGMGHLYRCLPPLRGRVVGYVALTLVWQVLFAFIVHRMARLLEIW